MAQFQNIYPIDLNIKKKGARELLQPIGEGDANGVRVGAQVFADGAPVTLNGQCVAKVIRADGSTVPLTGTISGNIASVALDQQSCAVEGPIQVAVMWVSGTNVPDAAPRRDRRHAPGDRRRQRRGDQGRAI